MVHREIFEELSRMTTAEMAFRDVKLVKNGSMSAEEFQEKYRSCPTDVAIALFPEKAETILNNQGFIREGKHIGVMKHGRGMPLYFHEHSFFEMFYVLEGKCTQYFEQTISGLSSADKLDTVECEMVSKSGMELQKGDFCLLSPGIRHAIREDGTALILNILIRYDTFMDIFINTIRDKSAISEFFLGNLYSAKKQRMLLFHTAEDERIRDYVLDLYEEQKQGDEYADRICCSIVTILFAQLVRRFQSTMETSGQEWIKNENVLSMLRYMIANYDSVTIEQVAREFHFTRQYCSRLIHETTGRTFREIVTDIRVEKGKQLLMYSELNTEQISEQIGYANPETFIRMMKRATGMTPGQYRKSQPFYSQSS